MTAELIESLAKRKSRQVKEVRIDTCDVVESADETEVVADLGQIIKVLQNLKDMTNLIDVLIFLNLNFV